MNCDFGVFMYANDTVEGAAPIQDPNEKSTPHLEVLFAVHMLLKSG